MNLNPLKIIKEKEDKLVILFLFFYGNYRR